LIGVGGAAMDATKNKATEEQAYNALRLAQIHAELSSNSSAEFCAKEAARFYNQEWFGFCHEWAKESLSHSVGIFHNDYDTVETEEG
jgi:hypothetical protein